MIIRINPHTCFATLHNALGIVLCFCVLCACTREHTYKSHLFISAGVMQETDGGELTRGIYQGYEAFDAVYDAATADQHTIGVFVASDEMGAVYSKCSYTAANNWVSETGVLADVDSYVFGMMPTCAIADESAMGINFLPLSTSYADGAKLTIPGIPALSHHDLCIITGVANGVVDDTVQSIQYADLVPGVFQYHAPYVYNSLYLLFDHLYSRINLRFNIDANYFDVHSISLDSVRVRTQGVSDFTASVALRANTTKQKPMSATFSGSGTAGCSMLLHAADTMMLSTKPDSALVLPMYVCPGVGQTFVIEVVYDIYDKQNNIVDPHRRASNTFSLKEQGAVVTLEPGKAYNLPLLVQPSYLYDLSDPDAGNIQF